MRLPEGLRARADVLSRELDISLNSLVVVALHDYLREREVTLVARGAIAAAEARRRAPEAGGEDPRTPQSRQERRAAERAARKGG